MTAHASDHSTHPRLLEEWHRDDRRVVMRTACWDDLESYAAMHRELYRERVMASTYNADTAMAGKMLSDRLVQDATGTGLLVVVSSDSQIVAEGTLSPSNGDGSITLGLLVLKDYRHMGIGKRLMAALEPEARRLGKSRIDLTVWRANENACRLYAAMGYREVGCLPDWVRSDLAATGKSDLLWLLKDL
ncbi:MAG: GNAT family N-acetyltransferase [Lentisphaerae bacterium]|jgi:GNAT superfamily N-acetyltransferase|nr:GNAT family N-acetyltransferase [Lentisphaerota bacterium]MBT5609862.1 GNAT family N-acetyltransferase [Lentisphaerota bacterium]MBT7845729.1 GNAT family N-acetyltransferase [Lentisphaerota bacterium]